MALNQGSAQLCSNTIILEGMSTLPWKCFDQGGYYFKALKHELENLASTSSFEELVWLFSICDLDLKDDNINSELLSKNLKNDHRVTMKSSRIVSRLQQLWFALEENDTKERKLCLNDGQSAFDQVDLKNATLPFHRNNHKQEISLFRDNWFESFFVSLYTTLHFW